MSLRSTMAKAGSSEPRAVRLVRARNEGSLGPKQLSDLQLSRRLSPLLPFIASGDIPLPEDKATAVGRAFEQAWNRPKENTNAP